jgi:hypothetical protein
MAAPLVRASQLPRSPTAYQDGSLVVQVDDILYEYLGIDPDAKKAEAVIEHATWSGDRIAAQNPVLCSDDTEPLSQPGRNHRAGTPTRSRTLRSAGLRLESLNENVEEGSYLR